MAKLTDLIDSKEKWEAYKAEHDHTVTQVAVHRNAAAQIQAENTLRTDAAMLAGLQTPDWWVERESARLAKVYEVSPVLSVLNTHHPCFAHISQRDRNMVAFTPTIEAGRTDKQVPTTIGKLLAKYYPTLQDHKRAMLAEYHNAYANTKLEFGTGYEAILEAYMAEGLGSCMSKPELNQWKFHPCVVYDVPTVAVAVTRNKDGAINGRALVRTDKKVYIRAYGNPALKRLLEKEGYVPGTWEGIQFRTEEVEETGASDGRWYFMPYLDSNGTIASDATCTVVLYDGKLTVVPRGNLQAIPPRMSAAPGTSGIVRLKNISRETFEKKDAVTGESLSLLTDKAVKLYTGGEILHTKEENIGDRALVKLYTSENTQEHVYVTPDEYKIEQGCVVNAYFWLAKGYVKLDETLYPGEVWVYRGYARVRPDAGAIKQEDAAMVVKISEGRIDTEWVHKSSIIKKVYTRVHPKETGWECYAAPGVKVDKTLSGRKVVIGFNDVQPLATGGVDFIRNIVRVTVLGDDLWVSKSMTTAEREAFAITKTEEMAYEKMSQGVSFKTLARNLSMFNYSDLKIGTMPRHSVEVSLQILGETWVGRNNTRAQALFRGVKKYLAEAEAKEAPNRLVDVAPEAKAEAEAEVALAAWI